jgi:hypothetical protein
MDIIQTYCIYSFNSIILSKIILKSLIDIPNIKKLSLFYFINNKQYKKNLLLFYIIISLIFGGTVILKKKELQKLYIFNLTLKKKHCFNFLLCFINVYLPLIDITENLLKTATLPKLKKKELLYRLNYFHFPAIIELDPIYINCERIHNFVSNYRLQLDFYIKTCFYIKNVLEFIPRMYRFPCVFKFEK